MPPRVGFEPTTFWVETRRAIRCATTACSQLSYTRHHLHARNLPLLKRLSLLLLVLYQPLAAILTPPHLYGWRGSVCFSPSRFAEPPPRAVSVSASLAAAAATAMGAGYDTSMENGDTAVEVALLPYDLHVSYLSGQSAIRPQLDTRMNAPACVHARR